MESAKLVAWGCLVRGGAVSSAGEHRPYKPGVTGSNPVPPTRDNAKCERKNVKWGGKNAGLSELHFDFCLFHFALNLSGS